MPHGGAGAVMTIQKHIGGEHFLVIGARIGDVVFRDPMIVGGGPLLQRSFGITGFAQLVGALDQIPIRRCTASWAA